MTICHHWQSWLSSAFWWQFNNDIQSTIKLLQHLCEHNILAMLCASDFRNLFSLSSWNTETLPRESGVTNEVSLTMLTPQWQWQNNDNRTVWQMQWHFYNCHASHDVVVSTVTWCRRPTPAQCEVRRRCRCHVLPPTQRRLWLASSPCPLSVQEQDQARWTGSWNQSEHYNDNNS